MQSREEYDKAKSRIEELREKIKRMRASLKHVEPEFAAIQKRSREISQIETEIMRLEGKSISGIRIDDPERISDRKRIQSFFGDEVDIFNKDNEDNFDRVYDKKTGTWRDKTNEELSAERSERMKKIDGLLKTIPNTAKERKEVEDIMLIMEQEYTETFNDRRKLQRLKSIDISDKEAIEQKVRSHDNYETELLKSENLLSNWEKKQSMQNRRDVSEFFNNGVVKGSFDRVFVRLEREVINGEVTDIPIVRPKTTEELYKDRIRYKNKLEEMRDEDKISDETYSLMKDKIKDVYDDIFDERKKNAQEKANGDKAKKSR